MAFPSAIGCLRAAVESQRGLESYDWPEGRPVRVRMGMHTGEPTRTGEGYVGMDVHAAARICSAGHGGQILLSHRTAELAEEELATEELTLRDLGEHRLKDLEGPQQLFQVVIPELSSDFSPLRTLETRPNNLPTPPTPFIGRAKEVAEVRDLLLRDGVRVVTLTGPGGTGKSRLALRVATELLHSFADGAFFVALASVRRHALVMSALARALGVREGQGRTLQEALEDHLRDRAILLVFDNFEHVRQAGRPLAELMAQCPGVKVLITSREALRLSGEYDVPVPPLGLPERGRLPAVLELASYEAIRLFVDRAQAARSDFDLNDENATPVTDICRRLDGLPLAIELAAARVRTMLPSELLPALESRLTVLTDGAIDLPERQQTLRDAIAWSFDLLEPAEQVLCRRLGVFVGGCTLEAARDVCDVESKLDLDEGTTSLVSKSLLGIEMPAGREGPAKVLPSETPIQDSRFAMLETIREFALDQLEQSGEAEELRMRHRDWCLDLAEAAEPELRSADSERWLERLDSEHDNVRSALGWSLDGVDDGAEAALRIGTSLMVFWYQRGHLSEMREWLDRGLEAGPEAEPRLRATALYGAAGMARQQGELEEAALLCEDALKLYRGIEDSTGIARALGELGAILQRQGQFDRAAAALEEALRLLRELGDPERTSFTLVALGALEQIRGNPDQAAGHYEESLEIARDLGDKHGTATALVNLGEVTQLRGDNQRAAVLYRESLLLYAELKMDIAIAYCLEVLAGIDAAEGLADRAAQLFGAAENVREEIGAPVESFNLERYQGDVSSVREALERDTFDAAWATGRALSREQATALALRSTT